MCLRTPEPTVEGGVIYCMELSSMLTLKPTDSHQSGTSAFCSNYLIAEQKL